jgi:hypothetical protein
VEAIIMGWELKTMMKSIEVPSGQTVAETYTPGSGVSELAICYFRGDGAFNPNAVVKLVWKYDHATEEEINIWTTKGGGEMPCAYSITDCDGTRKLAVVLENGLDGPIAMSGMAAFKERT